MQQDAMQGKREARELLQGANSWPEVEKALAGLSQPDAAFRWIVLALLATGRLLFMRAFHPPGQIPLTLHRRLSPACLAALATPAWDGLLEIPWGDPWLAAIRFSAMPPTAKETAAFLLPEALPRLLVSNSRSLPPRLFQQPGLSILDGWHLRTRLPHQLPAMRRWLQTGLPAGERCEPPALIRETTQALLPGGEGHLLVHHAPGESGLELLLALATAYGGSRSLTVLLPSRAHLQQIAAHWENRAPWAALACLAVCREKGGSRSLDLPLFTDGECGFPLVREVAAVKEFLAWRFSGTRILLATPSGWPILHEALEAFPASQSALLLPEWHLSRNALPTGWQTAWQAHQGKAPHIHLSPLSTPWENGPPLEITLTQAQQHGLAKPWRLALLRVPETEEAPQTGENMPEAVMEALAQVPALLRLPRLVTCHRDAASAKNFLQAFSGRFPQTFGGCHLTVAGNQSRTERNTTLERFASAPAALLATAQVALFHRDQLADAAFCLWDIESLKGDIAPLLAAVTAAHGSGANGWLVLPLKGDRNLATWKASFSQWIRLLGEADAAFTRQVRSLRQNIGRGDGADMRPLLQRFLLIDREAAEESFFRLLGQTVLEALSSDWDEQFGSFLKHVQLHGTRDPLPEENPGLLAWIGQQRRDHRLGKGRPEEVELLNRHGFIWDMEAWLWNQSWQRLLQHRQTTGSALVPEKWEADPPLAEWAAKQRQLRNQKKLEESRQKRLDQIGFVWDLEEAAWMDSFSRWQANPLSDEPELQAWVQRQRKQHAAGKLPEKWTRILAEHGFDFDPEESAWTAAFQRIAHHLEATGRFPEENSPDDAWIESQRRLYHKQRLATERLLRLEALGIDWNPEETAWNRTFQELLGLFPPWPSEESPLGQWVESQRRLRRKGGLSEDRMARLEQLDIDWNPEETAWQAMFAHFRECRWPARESELERWCAEQRRLMRSNRLSAERMRQLEAVCFIWDPLEAEWEQQFNELRLFRQERGHCHVPREWQASAELPRWIGKQRKLHREGLLAAEKVSRLEQLGLVWNPGSNLWEEQFAALAAFKEKHGHCMVPESWEEDPELGWWIKIQRQLKRNGKLDQEQARRLDELGFIWDEAAALWEESFVQLLAYKMHSGHTNVPEEYRENPRLGRWVAAQRNAQARGLLSRDQRERLEALGFVWDPREVLAEEFLMALAKFKEEHGHCHVPLDWIPNPKLGLWVLGQRQRKQRGELKQERVQRLDALGFEWD
ncbi:MAG: helicase associated domain-containing protein [Magnetococcales bacterium]|nr:helicase associated domain-containing protein [Magnetococcales bacterium]